VLHIIQAQGAGVWNAGVWSTQSLLLWGPAPTD
jgi:hypothetical protein